MEGLGRLHNVVPIAAGKGLSLKNASGVTFICTGNDTFSLTSGPTVAASAAPGNVFVRKFTNTATDGTAKWVKGTQSASAAVTISSGTVAVHVDGNSLPDTHTYVKLSAASAGLVTAVFEDLVIQRSPDNLPIISA